LVDLNQTLSRIVNQMQAEFAKKSDKVNLDDVQNRLSQELTEIQRDAQRFRSTRDKRETIQRIYEQSSAQAAKKSQSLFL
jgi:septum formation inhibitor-activating ATPase MinD